MIKKHTSKRVFFILVSMAMGLVLACDSGPNVKKQAPPSTVTRKISVPVNKKQPPKKETNDKINETKTAKKSTDTVEQFSAVTVAEQEKEHYDSQGKIDPFKPLIQEQKQVEAPVVEKRPERVLTPLEKIELSQVRLVAVINMKNRSIAMVEEASGKGYEVKIGTYIGKNQGKVSEIKSSSIVVKEIVKDFKGRLKERIQEIKLHKMEEEG